MATEEAKKPVNKMRRRLALAGIALSGVFGLVVVGVQVMSEPAEKPKFPGDLAFCGGLLTGNDLVNLLDGNERPTSQITLPRALDPESEPRPEPGTKPEPSGCKISQGLYLSITFTWVKTSPKSFSPNIMLYDLYDSEFFYHADNVNLSGTELSFKVDFKTGEKIFLSVEFERISCSEHRDEAIQLGKLYADRSTQKSKTPPLTRSQYSDLSWSSLQPRRKK